MRARSRSRYAAPRVNRLFPVVFARSTNTGPSDWDRRSKVPSSALNSYVNAGVVAVGGKSAAFEARRLSSWGTKLESVRMTRSLTRANCSVSEAALISEHVANTHEAAMIAHSNRHRTARRVWQLIG